MKDAATKSYSRKGDAIVKMNHDAIDRGATGYVKVDVPASWKDAVDDSQPKVATGNRPELVDYVNNVVYPVNSFHGKDLPVSTFENYADGTSPQGTAAYEKRGVAVDVPEWIAGQLHPVQPVLLCVSRMRSSVPVAMTDEELAARSRRHQGQAHDRCPRHELRHGHLPAGLHRLRLLRDRLPRQEGRKALS